MKLTVIADTHYYAKSLGTSGDAYELRSKSDQKCLAESEDILRAHFDIIANSDADAVLIAGDLTNNGERASHEGFRCLLYNLQKHKPVYVITATHDWCCDQNPRRYEGDQVFRDVPVMGHDELRDFYQDFGPNQAIAEYFTHLGTSSYVIELSSTTWLLAINDDQNGKGRAGYTPEHLAWILERLRLAKERNVTVIAMQHHLLLPTISPLFTGGACVGDREEMAEMLADAGLCYIFVGHTHMQRVTRYDSPAGNTLYQINVGAACGYPAPMVYVHIQEDGLAIKTEHLEAWRDFLKDKATGLVTRVLDSAAAGDKREFARRFTAMQGDGEKAVRWFWIIRPAARYLYRLRVRKAAKLIWLISFGRAIRRREIKGLPDIPVMEMVKGVMLSVFDGGMIARECGGGYYKAVMAAMSLPYIFKTSEKTKQFMDATDAILTGGEFNHNDAFLPAKSKEMGVESHV